MKLFSADVTIAATILVVAENEEEAKALALSTNNEFLEFSDRRQEVARDLYVTGETYSADMPQISLSPAMTLYAKPEDISMVRVDDFEEAQNG
ncbi:MAG: hypothetical protein JJ902_05355 [Roseibium sp.]|nr:hypothetical protein [Roseibium sp.]